MASITPTSKPTKCKRTVDPHRGWPPLVAGGADRHVVQIAGFVPLGGVKAAAAGHGDRQGGQQRHGQKNRNTNTSSSYKEVGDVEGWQGVLLPPK